jgi:hypothetical protein
MIEFNNLTCHDFLGRSVIQKLLDAGINMDDSKYVLVKDPITKTDFVCLRKKPQYKYIFTNGSVARPGIDVVPTYTISELLYKVPENISLTIDGKQYSGGLRFFKNTVFYVYYYDLKSVDDKKDSYIFAEGNTPLESLASILYQCHKKNIGIKKEIK